jgi:hypothetical protein
LKKIDINVSAMDDDDMIRLMTTENVTQHGARAAAVSATGARLVRFRSSLRTHCHRRFFKVPIAPQDRNWMWASGHNGEIRRAAHGYEATVVPQFELPDRRRMTSLKA